jgi:hypothetical protein
MGKRSLSLARGLDEPNLQLLPERRVTQRWPQCETATALRVAGPQFGLMHELAVDDISDDGMGAYCNDVIEPGAVVSIGFASRQRHARRAVVVQCQPIGDGYRVGFRFEQRLAA